MVAYFSWLTDMCGNVDPRSGGSNSDMVSCSHNSQWDIRACKSLGTSAVLHLSWSNIRLQFMKFMYMLRTIIMVYIHANVHVLILNFMYTRTNLKAFHEFINHIFIFREMRETRIDHVTDYHFI